MTREHDDFGFGPAFLDLWEQVQPVGVAQFNVQQHHVGLLLAESLLQRRAVFGLGYEVMVFEHLGEQGAQVVVVIHDHYFAIHKFLLRWAAHARVNAVKMAR